MTYTCTQLDWDASHLEDAELWRIEADDGSYETIMCSERTVIWLDAQLNKLASIQEAARQNGKRGGAPKGKRQPKNVD